MTFPDTLFIALCIIFIAICVLVHLSLLFWVLYNAWKITLQRSLRIQEENKENDFESEDLTTNGISDTERYLTYSEQLEISVNPKIVVYKVPNSTTELFSCRQSKGDWL